MRASPRMPVIQGDADADLRIIPTMRSTIWSWSRTMPGDPPTKVVLEHLLRRRSSRRRVVPISAVGACGSNCW